MALKSPLSQPRLLGLLPAARTLPAREKPQARRSPCPHGRSGSVPSTPAERAEKAFVKPIMFLSHSTTRLGGRADDLSFGPRLAEAGSWLTKHERAFRPARGPTSTTANPFTAPKATSVYNHRAGAPVRPARARCANHRDVKATTTNNRRDHAKRPAPLRALPIRSRRRSSIPEEEYTQGSRRQAENQKARGTAPSAEGVDQRGAPRPRGLRRLLRRRGRDRDGDLPAHHQPRDAYRSAADGRGGTSYRTSPVRDVDRCEARGGLRGPDAPLAPQPQCSPYWTSGPRARPS